MTNGSTTNRPRLIAGNVLLYSLGALLIGSAVAKVAQIPKLVENFRVLGYEGSRLTSIAMLEAICATLFLLPRTRSLGLLLVSAYLGGAMAVHVAHGQSEALVPAMLLGIIWLAAWLRHPEMLFGMTRSNG